MAAVLYTDSDQIRAVFGVRDVEISDKMLIDLDLATLVKIELDLVYSAHAAAQAASVASGASEAARDLFNRIRMFCAYQGAVFLLPSIQFSLAQKITDGDAEMQRFIKDDLVKAELKIIQMRDYLAGILNPDNYSIESLIISPMLVATPDYDPVENTGAI